MAKASLIASLSALPSASGAELTGLPTAVEWLEVRADLVGDLDADWLRNHFHGRISYALRSEREGGVSTDSAPDRQQRLARAARSYDRVELEDATDLSESLLAQIPVEKRLLAWHGTADDLAALTAKFQKLSETPASLYKLITTATRIRSEFDPLLLLKSLQSAGRSDTIAYCDGPMGFWNRLAALQLGAPAVHGLVASDASNAGEPTIAQLIRDYGLPELQPINQIFAIIGNPIFHSLSPRLHNAAYRALGYPALFVPLRVESFAEFWTEVVQSRMLDSLGLPINGMTVASPHKEAVLLTTQMVSPMARLAESANVLVRNNGSWKADTTDPEVIYMAGRERGIRISERRAAVIGCGGAGRAIAATLAQSGAGVTLINRGAERGEHAAKLLGLPYVSLPQFDAVGYDIVVNATPVGRDSDETPFQPERLNNDAVVIDLVYGSRPTTLVGNTLARELIAIDGRDVLLTQVLRQFRMMTNREMPASIATDMLGRHVSTADVAGAFSPMVQSMATAVGTDAN